jgi:hypothetical protein
MLSVSGCFSQPYLYVILNSKTQKNELPPIAGHSDSAGRSRCGMIGNHPAVAAGVLSYEVKKWWVAEGAFCETGIRRD